jgi:hypothetical protein
VNIVFALVIVPSAAQALWAPGAPKDFAKPEAAYRDFPHAHFSLWVACSYFLYHLGLAIVQAQDLLDVVHASFSFGGGVFSALAPRMQNMYMWLMVFSEITNLLLQPRYVLLNCDLVKIYPRTFHYINLAFFGVFTISRMLILAPRYVVHVMRICQEFRGDFPEADLANRSWLQPFFDLVMTTLSTGLNLVWFRIMAVKAWRMFKGKEVDTKVYS